MKFLLPATISIVLILLAPTDSLACLCKPEPANKAIKRLKKEADAIFTGTVKTVTKEGREFIVTLTVLDVWKSDGARQITIRTTSGGCSAYFKAEETYLIFARKDEFGDLRTNVCMRTGLLVYSDDDLKHLGKPLKTDATKPKKLS